MSMQYTKYKYIYIYMHSGLISLIAYTKGECLAASGTEWIGNITSLVIDSKSLALSVVYLGSTLMTYL